MGRQEDEALARAIADHDTAAEAAFDLRFRSRVEAIVRKRGIPDGDCADVVQRVLNDALRQLRLGQFRGEATLGTWLHPIIGGGISNYRRKPGGPQLVPLDEVVPADHHSLVTAQNSDSVLAVRQALYRLSAEDQLLLVLYYHEGQTLAEIGPMVGLRKSAVAEHLKMARERFRVALGGGNSLAPKRLKDR